MTKRKTLVIIITLFFILALCLGCVRSNTESSTESATVSNTLTDEPSIQKGNKVAGLIVLSDTFDEKENDFETYILYDSETYVMYALVRDYHNAASAFGFFNLVDSNGKPRLYNSEDAKVGSLIVLSDTFDEKENNFETYILYDSETYVMYALVRDYHNAASAFGTSILLNSDGNPRLYNP